MTQTNCSDELVYSVFTDCHYHRNTNINMIKLVIFLFLVHFFSFVLMHRWCRIALFKITFNIYQKNKKYDIIWTSKRASQFINIEIKLTSSVEIHTIYVYPFILEVKRFLITEPNNKKQWKAITKNPFRVNFV